MKTLLGLILFFNLTTFAADYASQCGKFPSPMMGGYCVHIPTTHKSNDVIYYLHGRGGDEKQWQDNWYYTAQLRSEWNKKQVALPTVVSISFGPVWILAEKNSSSVSSLFEVVRDQIMPSIEAQLGGVKGRRLILGESMGGFNTIQLALKTNLFAKAAIICAPMSEISPFVSEKEYEDHVKKSSAWQYYQGQNPNPVLSSAKQLVQLAKTFFPTPQEWSKGDPLQLATASTSQKTDLYVTAGFYDIYALYEANEKFASSLQSHGFNVEWHPQWGGHCAIDITSLAQFLAE